MGGRAENGSRLLAAAYSGGVERAAGKWTASPIAIYRSTRERITALLRSSEVIE